MYFDMAISRGPVKQLESVVLRNHALSGQNTYALVISVLCERKTMNRFEQRLQKRLQNKEIAEGYREMAAELELMHAIDSIRKQQHMSQETLAALMGKKREAISRLFSADDSNPTLDTLIELLSALNLTADITLRQAREGEGPIKVATELAPS